MGLSRLNSRVRLVTTGSKYQQPGVNGRVRGVDVLTPHAGASPRERDRGGTPQRNILIRESALAALR